MKFSRTAVLITVLAAGIAASALAYQLRPDVPPVTGARRLADLPGAAPYYVWLNVESALLLRDPKRPSFSQYVLNTGAETPVPALNAVFQKSQGRPDSLRVAPDGAYLLWTSEDRLRTSVVRLDGTNYTETTHSVPSLAYWRADGQRWVALEVRGDRLGMARTFPREKPVASGFTPLSANVPTDKVNLAQALITTEGQFMVQTRDGVDKPLEKANLALLAFSANSAYTQTMNLPAPHVNQGGEVFFASISHLMGWSLRFQQPLPNLLHNLGGGAATNRFLTGFWVTSQQTRKTTMLGYVETTRNDANSGPFNVQFTPDGRNISYVYQNVLYLLPVRFP